MAVEERRRRGEVQAHQGFCLGVWRSRAVFAVASEERQGLSKGMPWRVAAGGNADGWEGCPAKGGRLRE